MNLPDYVFDGDPRPRKVAGKRSKKVRKRSSMMHIDVCQYHAENAGETEKKARYVHSNPHPRG